MQICIYNIIPYVRICVHTHISNDIHLYIHIYISLRYTCANISEFMHACDQIPRNAFVYNVIYKYL